VVTYTIYIEDRRKPLGPLLDKDKPPWAQVRLCYHRDGRDMQGMYFASSAEAREVLRLLVALWLAQGHRVHEMGSN
jgi:hypothetical protein